MIINNFGYGIFLTPQNRPRTKLSSSEALDRKTAVNGGLIYDEHKNIVEQSLDTRFSAVSINTDLPVIDLPDNTYMFLGYSFRQYGHFILEALPMLSYCMDPEFASYNKMFLPYFLNANNIVGGMNPSCRTSLLGIMRSFLNLLDVDQNKIYYHTENAILKSNFIVPPKVLHGKFKVIDNYNFHRIVIDKLVTKLPTDLRPQKRVFLRRPSNRITSTISDTIASFCQSIGFHIVDMEKLSIFDQLQLMRQTKILLGFSGSAMHNSMFLHSDAIAINLADLRDFKASKCYIPNQKLSNKISGCQEHFIDFKCQDDMTSISKNLELSQTQEEYVINYLQQSIINAINLYD